MRKPIKVWDKTSTGKKSQCASVYHTDGIFPTINAGTHGYSMGQIMEEHTIAYSKSHREDKKTGHKWLDARGKIDDEGNTLSTGDGCTSQSTGNYVFTKVDMTDIKFVGGVNPKKTWNKDDQRNLSRNYSQGERIHHPDGISPCISASMGGTANGSTLITESDIRIRKLTPLECERLQGYPDNHTKYGRREDGSIYEISNTQRYKLVGNGISATVPETIFPSVFGTEPLKVLDLFSGCHGTGLRLPTNFECVGFSEVDKYANDVLRYHYPDIINYGDVTQLINQQLPHFDLLTFGYPCQDVSSAGSNKGDKGERTSLIWSVCDLIEMYKPKYICAENVKNHLSKKHEEFFTQVLERLSSIGYDLDFEVVNSKHFGLAQNRQRVFIIGKLR